MPQELCEIILDAAVYGVFLKTGVKGLGRQHPLLFARWHRAAVTVYDLSPYQPLIQSVCRWRFKGQEWVRQKFLLSLFVAVLRISMWRSAGTQELVTLFTQAWAIRKWQCGDYSKMLISHVHIVCYWVQSCLTLPEMPKRNFLSSYTESNASGRGFVGYNRQVSSENRYQPVCFSIDLIHNLKVKGYQAAAFSDPAYDDGQARVRWRKGFSIWNVICPLRCYCPLLETQSAQQSPWKGHVSAHPKFQSTLGPLGWSRSSELQKSMSGHRWVQRRGGGSWWPCLLRLGPLLSPLVERFNVRPSAVSFFFC